MMTLAEAAAAAEGLSRQGWTVIPCDEPERAVRGWWAQRGEEEQAIEGALFGDAEYAPEVELVDGQALLDFASAGVDGRCDDPKARQLGFVRYDHGRQVAMVRRITLTGFKDSAPAVRDAIQLLRRQSA